MEGLVEDVLDGIRSLCLVEVDIHDLKEGDHIYAFRGVGSYSHHGIYVGNGSVIHFMDIPPGGGSARKTSSGSARACKSCGFDRDLHGGVVKTCVDCFIKSRDPLNHCNLYRYRYRVSKWEYHIINGRRNCTTLPSRPSKEVVAKAHELLEKGFGQYNLITRNCEDFATYCKTGKAHSGQVVSVFGPVPYTALKSFN
ncbi:hypothetical protein Tsubulata_005319 [Turnera subulata]|uniref:LRAT domain-containing protein n=1 Tax=Turnera subulata TaxID=218843 RepID=A0A9Q0IXY0_9ROSI|nr:hypothetical protein Tsubulata_005319 [Turnera subulata]